MENEERGLSLDRVRSVFGELDDPSTPLTASEVAESIDCARRTAFNKLETLADRGELETKKVGARARVWWRPSPSGGANDPRAVHQEPALTGVLDTADVGVFVLDAELDVAWINEATERYFGLRRADVVGQDKRDLVREEITDAVANPDDFAETVLATYRDNTYAEEFECRVVAGDNRSWRWLEHRSEPIESGRFAGGRIELYYDVTDRHELEQQLERQRNDLRNELDEVYDRVTDAFHGLDADWRFTHVNERAEALIGSSEARLRGRYIWDVLPDAAERSFREPFERAMDTQEPVSLEEYSPVADIWLEMHAYPSESGLSVYFRDVTERKEREQELERYKTILDTVGDPVYTLDPDGCLTYINDAFCEAFDTTRDVILGEHVSLAMADDDIERATAKIRGLLADDSRDSVTLEYEMTLLDGSAVPFENNLTLLPFDEDGKFRGTAGVLRDLTERKKRESELRRQRAELAALDNLNSAVRGIYEAVIEQSTREAIERTVCASLAESDAYRFAWIGEVDPKTGSIEPRVEAGVDGFLDAIPLSADPGEPPGQGKVGTAIRSKEMQVIQNALTDSDVELWRPFAREFDYRSAAAIPIVYENTLYGVLGVHAERAGGFAGGEAEVVGQLGEIVGHAIAAIERKRALMSDEIVEVEFRVPEVFGALDDVEPFDGEIRFDQIVPIDNELSLQYGTATEDAIPVLETLADEHPDWLDVTLFDRQFGPARFQARCSGQPVVSLIAASGGDIQQATVEGGDLYATVHLPTSTALHRIVDVLRERYPAAEMVTRRQKTRSETARVDVGQALAEELTDRQRTALEIAFHSGFFESPRKNTGAELADSMGITPSTFHQHLRKAQQEVLRELLAGPETS